MSEKLLDQALAAYKVGGQEALEAWFESLTDEERAQFVAVLNKVWNLLADWMEAFQAHLANFFHGFSRVFVDVANEWRAIAGELEEDDDTPPAA